MKRTQPTIVEQIRAEAQTSLPPKPVDKLLTSGAEVYDAALGGGHAWGRIINLVGDKSTGKTLLAAEIIVAACKALGKRLKWCYNDAEAGFTFDTKAIYGIDVLGDEEPSETMEEFIDDFRGKLSSLQKKQYLIYVLDSLDALTSKAELKRQKEGSDKGTYNLEKQKKLSEFFRLTRLAIKKDKNVLLVVISQVRQNIGVSFGEKYRRTGGKALDFYAAQIVWLAEVARETKGEITTGITIKARVKKNKIGKPYRNAFINIIFDYGIDDIGSSIDYLYGTRDKRGKIKDGRKDKLKWNGKKYTKRLLIRHIEKANLEEKLIRKVQEKWAKAEADAMPDRKRRYA